MMRRLILLLCMAGVFLVQAGCGGGGTTGGSGGAGGSSLSGTASKGLIKNGTVKIYALNADGSRGSLLATAATDDSGRYSQTLNGYSGPILAVAYGSYLDEATGVTVTLDESNGLRAALPYASGAVSLPVTALTELAVRKALPSLTSANISNANGLISAIFNVDIIGTNPVDATVSAMSASGVTAAQRDYTLALAAFSQLCTTSSGSTAAARLDAMLNAMVMGMTSTSISPQMSTAFTNAVTAYLDNHSSIRALILNSGGSALVAVGSVPVRIDFSLAGAVSNLYGASFTLHLPPGVTINATENGTASTGVIGLTASTAGDLAIGYYTPASSTEPAALTVVLAGTSRAIGNGAFLVINAKLDTARSPTVTAGSFALTGAAFSDLDGAPLTGPTLTISDVAVD